MRTHTDSSTVTYHEDGSYTVESTETVYPASTTQKILGTVGLVAIMVAPVAPLLAISAWEKYEEKRDNRKAAKKAKKQNN